MLSCPAKNEGTADRLIRFVIAVALFSIAYARLVGIAQVIVAVIGAAILFTSIFGYCHLYTLLGITTSKSRK